MITIIPRITQADSLAGKWVSYDGHIGIVAALPGDGKVELHIIGHEGLFERSLLVDAKA